MNYPLTYQDFVSSIKMGKLLGIKCNACKHIIVPPSLTCVHCEGSDFEVVELSRDGVIETFTIIEVAPEPFTPPYVVSIAKLLEGPRLMGNLVNVDTDILSLDYIGRKIKVGCQDLRGDQLSGGERVAITFELV